MPLLPTSLGLRPRLAVELRPEGVVAARAEDAQALISAVSYSLFPEGTLAPGLKPGNIPARGMAVAAVRRALEAVALKERATTLILPDAAVRVLLLDFDALPAKPAEALPIVRFRLKKLLPFDSDDAVVSYQIMSSARGMVRVLAVAIPREILAEYESIVREAGFDPGAVLPSTLAACAGLNEVDLATLLVNAGETSVTTAIVQGGVLLLHRTVDLAAEGLSTPYEQAGETANPALEVPAELLARPASTEAAIAEIVSVEETHGEWAAQQPRNGFGVIDDHLADQHLADQHLADEHLTTQAAIFAYQQAQELPPMEQDQPLDREEMLPPLPTPRELEARRLSAAEREVTQAVSVAAAYFEDTLSTAPGLILAAGSIGAETLDGLLREAGLGATGLGAAGLGAAGLGAAGLGAAQESTHMHVRELFEPVMLAAAAATTRVPHGWIAGVRGALRS